MAEQSVSMTGAEQQAGGLLVNAPERVILAGRRDAGDGLAGGGVAG